MWIIKREDPTPPPPPPKKPPWWVNFIFPVIVTVILGLLSIVYNSVADDVKSKADKEVTMKMIETNQQNITKQQEALDKTLQVIIEIQTERKMEKENKDRDNRTQPSVNVTSEKPPLSPSEFKEYLKLSPEERAAFRQLHPSYESLPK